MKRRISLITEQTLIVERKKHMIAKMGKISVTIGLVLLMSLFFFTSLTFAQSAQPDHAQSMTTAASRLHRGHRYRYGRYRWDLPNHNRGGFNGWNNNGHFKGGNSRLNGKNGGFNGGNSRLNGKNGGDNGDGGFNGGFNGGNGDGGFNGGNNGNGDGGFNGGNGDGGFNGGNDDGGFNGGNGDGGFNGGNGDGGFSNNHVSSHR